MNLKFCTITGADTNTSHADMLRLSEKYPFVEWGILFGTQSNIPRFPSIEWVEALMHKSARQSRAINLCAHLCGRNLRAQLIGEAQPFNLEFFQRAQLNWHGQKWTVDSERMHAAMNRTTQQYIFQLDGVNDAHLQAAKRAGVNVAGIFDRSHGAGVVPDVIPAPINGVLCTYSGGIGPDNIASQLELIDRVVAANGVQSYCIDMETKVRSNINGKDVLDMCKVEACLAEAAKYVVRHS